MNRAELLRRLAGPPVGYRALFWSILAVAIPTFIRLGLDGHVTGVGVAPYVPFIILAAIFLCWKHAAAVALTSAIVADALFIGPPMELLEGPDDVVSLAFFLIASAIMIIFVHMMRRTIAASRKPDDQAQRPSGVVFSLERGEAWAGWHGQRSRIRLGPENEVADMMEDFLAQLELAERLNSPRL